MSGLSCCGRKWDAIDLLHALKDVESDHRISAKCSVQGSNPHSRGTGSIPGELSFPPLYRAVARSNRPHRIPCHRRANHRWSASSCGSRTASHGIRSTLCYVGPHQDGNPVWLSRSDAAPSLSVDPRLKTRVCAFGFYQISADEEVAVVEGILEADTPPTNAPADSG